MTNEKLLAKIASDRKKLNTNDQRSSLIRKIERDRAAMGWGKTDASANSPKYVSTWSGAEAINNSAWQKLLVQEKRMQDLTQPQTDTSFEQQYSQPLYADTVDNNPWTALVRTAAANGWHSDAADLLRSAVSDGLFTDQEAQDISEYAYDTVDEQAFTPQKRLEVLERERDKQNEAIANTSIAQYTKDPEDIKKYENALSRYGLFDRMYKSAKEDLAVLPYKQEAEAITTSRDSAFSTDIETVDSFIKEMESLQAEYDTRLLQASTAADAAYSALWNGSASNTDLTDAYDKALKEYQSVRDKAEDYSAQIYYANGIKSFLTLDDTDRENLLSYIALDNRRGNDQLPVYIDFYGNEQFAGNYQELKAVYDRIKDDVPTSDFERMEETLTAMYNSLRSAENNINNVRFANEHPILGGLASIFANIIGGVTATADIGMQSLEKFGDVISNGANGGYINPYDTNTLGFAPVNASDALRDTTAGNIERKSGETAADIYNVGMDVADGVTAFLLGGKAFPAISAANTGADWFLDAKSRGVDDTSALLTGVLAAGIEALFDKFSLERLLNIKNIQISTWKDALLQVEKNTVAGLGDGIVTSLAKYLSDYLTNDKLSVYGQVYAAQLKSGKSEYEAKQAALKQLAHEVFREGADGAIRNGLLIE